MALVKVRDLLNDAQKANTSIIAFDANDINTIYACIKGAEKARRPVIVMLYPASRGMMDFRSFTATVKEMAEKASVPVGLHLDHCSDFSMIMEAIRDGFSSVMADGSALPFEENVAFTKSVVDVAKVFDVDVEGELGHVGSVAAGDSYSDKSTFTVPEEAAEFAKLTGVTSLAVAFGSCHGVYKATPNLDLERLQEIDKATDTPLVLHGGSGIPHDQLVKAFTMGVNKFNVATEFFILYEKLQKQYYTEMMGKEGAPNKITFLRESLVDYVADKLQLCTMEV